MFKNAIPLVLSITVFATAAAAAFFPFFLLLVVISFISKADLIRKP